MKILVTNDDGIEAEGINVLSEVLSNSHEIYIIAPVNEKSACSNAITTRSEMKINEVGPNRYSVTGYPADCVNIGLHSDIIPEIDLIVSGINHGPNVGDDLIFSGTMAGARTAYVFGKPGIAVSVDSFHKPSEYFTDAAEFILNFIQDLHIQNPEDPYLFNINYPDLPKENINGTQYTFTGKRIYQDSFKKNKQGDNEILVSMEGTISSIYSEGSDVTALEKGYISITPVMTDATDYSLLETMKSGSYYV